MLLSPCRLCKGAWGPAFAGRGPGRCRRYPPRRDTARSPSLASRTATPPRRTAGRRPGTEARQRPGMRDKIEQEKAN